MRRPSRSASKARPPSAFEPSGGCPPTDADRAPRVRTVDQAGAREDEAVHGGVAGDARELPRAEIIDGLRLLGRGATKESRAVDHGVDAAHRGRERIHLEQIALDQLDTSFAQV